MTTELLCLRSVLVCVLDSSRWEESASLRRAGMESWRWHQLRHGKVWWNIHIRTCRSKVFKNSNFKSEKCKTRSSWNPMKSISNFLDSKFQFFKLVSRVLQLIFFRGLSVTRDVIRQNPVHFPNSAIFWEEPIEQTKTKIANNFPKNKKGNS